MTIQAIKEKIDSLTLNPDNVMDLLNKIPKKYLRLNDNHINIYDLITEYKR